MTKEKMTVHEALCEVKMSDKRVDKLIRNTSFCSAYRPGTKINGKDVKDYESEARESFQKILDIVKRTRAIKAALSKSNASTYIKVDDKEYTVAEALWLSSHGMDSELQLVNELKEQYSGAVNSINMANGGALDKRIDKVVADTLGSKDEASPEAVEDLSRRLAEQYRYVLEDPLDIARKIGDIEDAMDDFEKKMDSALQISNAITYIEFEY